MRIDKQIVKSNKYNLSYENNPTNIGRYSHKHYVKYVRYALHTYSTGIQYCIVYIQNRKVDRIKLTNKRIYTLHTPTAQTYIHADKYK